MKKYWFFGVLAAAIFMLAGCIVSRSDIDFSPSDPAIAKSNAKCIKVGKTTGEELIAIMGSPSTRHTLADDSEEFCYRYKKTVDSQFSVVPFVHFDDEKEENLELTFTVSNGVVTNVVSKPK